MLKREMQSQIRKLANEILQGVDKEKFTDYLIAKKNNPNCAYTMNFVKWAATCKDWELSGQTKEILEDKLNSIARTWNDMRSFKAELEVKVNYQSMTEEQKQDGKYYPDYAALVANASCEEERQYLIDVQKRNIGFAFNMVYTAKQSCGHYEIFQSPHNEYYTIDSIVEQAKEYAKGHKCTSCICNIGGKR